MKDQQSKKKKEGGGGKENVVGFLVYGQGRVVLSLVLFGCLPHHGSFAQLFDQVYIIYFNFSNKLVQCSLMSYIFLGMQVTYVVRKYCTVFWNHQVLGSTDLYRPHGSNNNVLVVQPTVSSRR